ncbi:MAG: cytochrome c [Caulobacteraceae bacterium]|nr:cytochrome c [Caulobacteraceae bacterium]
MLKRTLIALAALAALGVVAFGALAWRAPIAPITPPAASSFAPALVAQGETLAAAGNCATCHTRRDGAPFAGGLAMQTSFGTIYSTNITPDPETGIGAWSEDAFRRALHEGVARDGGHLFPAFPYDHFTKLSDTDVHALYAYLMTRPPVHAPAKASKLPFPLNLRALQAGWKLLFFRPGRFQPSPAHDQQWNRGAYLAEALGHCGACHTPRNALGAEKRNQAYAGAPIDNWTAPPLTAANPSPAPWTTPELLAYLGSGVSPLHGVAAGPMAPVVHAGLAKLPEADLRAVVAYIETVGGGDARAAATAPAVSRALAADRLGLGATYDADARLYTAACASCHYNAGAAPNAARPDLALNSAVSLPDPTNLIRVTLYGVGANEGAPGIVMPGFGAGFSDADVARIAAYLRRTRTSLPPWSNLEQKVAAIRAQGRGE